MFSLKKSLESKKTYNKQLDISFIVVDKTWKEHFKNINLSDVTNNRSFEPL